MSFENIQNLKVIAEEDFETEIFKIEDELSSIKSLGTFTAFDGTTLYYEYFLKKENNKNLVIVHGLSEFINKFYEFIYYCLNLGYNVFIYDQRCHGLSSRLTTERDLLHVDKFSDYVADLKQFIDQIVTKVSDEPTYLFAHSMGGAIAAFYLAENTQKIERAVLSAPMFRPTVTVVPFKIARAGIGIARHFYGNKSKFLLSKEFNPEVKYKEDPYTSKARFIHHLNMRRENENYQTTPMSFGWTYNSLIIDKKILSKSVAGKIKTPILLFSAENDTVVENEPQYKFSNKCNNCRLVNIEGATHALLASNDETLKKVLDLTFSFFEEN